MAGLYIKDAKLPDACWNCGWDPCMLWNEDRGDLPKHPNCPLVEVHDHGPLVDRDEFIGRQQSWALLISMGHGDDDEWVKCIGEICNHLYDAPVLIPADKERR